MKNQFALIPVITSVFLSILSPALSFAQSDTTDPGWPRMFESNGNEVVVHQPQLDQWDNHEKLHGKAIAGYNKWTDQGAVVAKNKCGDVYVGRNDNVYKRVDDGWEQNSGDGWTKFDTSAAKEAAQTRKDSVSSRTTSRDSSSRDTSSRTYSSGNRASDLNRQYTSRQRGNQRTTSYQRSRTSRGGFRGRR